MSEQEVGLPATDEGGGNFMSPGLQKMRIKSIVQWLNSKTKEPIKDKRGYPGLNITFINDQRQLINAGFFYSTSPLNAPDRQDDNLKCKSEYFLTNLKTALGFGKEPVNPVELKKPWFWGAVGETIMTNSNDEPTGKKYSFLVKKFFADGIKPAIAGDPLLPAANGVATGMFVERKVDHNEIVTESTVPERTATAQEKSSTAEQAEEKADDDMPVDDF